MVYFKLYYYFFSFCIKAPDAFSVLSIWVPFWLQEPFSWLTYLFSIWYICIPPHNERLSHLKTCTNCTWFYNVGTIWSKNHLSVKPPDISSTFIQTLSYTHIQLLINKNSIKKNLGRWLNLWKLITNTSCFYFITIHVYIIFKLICIIYLVWIHYFGINGLLS